ncbi:MAG: hypothetical protein DYG93_10300 [Leptolyngbya sp. PLA2]|nr:hypothetical protein [Leptolyngbya sp. PL-A2]MCQ3940400.1 hypothetical protein [cyanobacterium CYA1]MCZ7633865.1 hypothetical protein [Phycisphaerales bacterium]MDL1904250.1 hypothetical protein [Synechococcales cyanobacterium CNB]GIK19481.1 MAG: hypothetical protein BroJett004_16450 [Planctomycetota bacterium]
MTASASQPTVRLPLPRLGAAVALGTLAGAGLAALVWMLVGEEGATRAVMLATIVCLAAGVAGLVPAWLAGERSVMAATASVIAGTTLRMAAAVGLGWAVYSAQGLEKLPFWTALLAAQAGALAAETKVAAGVGRRLGAGEKSGS